MAQALLDREPVSLAVLEQFHGAGVYAIYYMGAFPAYSRLASHNKGGRARVPIYVGKAENKRRKGGESSGTRSTVLYRRLMEHLESIKQTKTLRSMDFSCRYLVVDDIWVPLGESLLIAKFSPVWNVLLDGFGNHDPGKGRYQGMRPKWDVLHPGRQWAEKCAARPESAKQVGLEVEEYLRAIPSDPPRFYVGEPVGEYLISDSDEPEES